MDSGAYNGNPAGIPAFMATACYKFTDARSPAVPSTPTNQKFMRIARPVFRR